MNRLLNIPSSDFIYDLPEDRIAKYPLELRNQSKLLLYKKGIISEDQFSNIADHIPENSLLVFNNTKVIHARLEFFKETGSRIEIFCLEPHAPSDYAMAFAKQNQCTWKCLVGNLKKWKSGKLSRILYFNDSLITLTVNRKSSENNFHFIEFEWDFPCSFAEILEIIGEIPIPPYLERKSEESDSIRYQTIYSKIEGSVAAPTAGLHFTEEEMKKLTIKGISFSEVTLHVGAGTFVPLKTEELKDHKMHTEHFIFSLSLVRNLLKHYPNIIAVGTTSVRTLESLIMIGHQIHRSEFSSHLHVDQWDAYSMDLCSDPLFALKQIEKHMISNNLSELKASTSIMIIPGYKFKIVQGLITNFHQPKSTLLALVSSFIGNDWKKVYDYALQNQFRFLSYGDSSLLLP